MTINFSEINFYLMYSIVCYKITRYWNSSVNYLKRNMFTEDESYIQNASKSWVIVGGNVH